MNYVNGHSNLHGWFTPLSCMTESFISHCVPDPPPSRAKCLLHPTWISYVASRAMSPLCHLLAPRVRVLYTNTLHEQCKTFFRCQQIPYSRFKLSFFMYISNCSRYVFEPSTLAGEISPVIKRSLCPQTLSWHSFFIFKSPSLRPASM